MPVRSWAATLAAVLTLATSAAAQDAVLGTWASPPDGKGQTGEVEVRPCGPALCGTLVRTFDSAGRPITTRNTGKRLFWDMQPQGGGRYGGGTVYVPIFDRTYAAKMQLESADRLRVSGCLGPVCKAQIWTRVR